MKNENIRSEDWKKRFYKLYSFNTKSCNYDWWDNYLHRRPYFKSIIRNNLPPERDIKIVDLGCGNGQLVFCLQEMGYKNITGVDTSKEQIQIAHQQGISNVHLSTIGKYLISKKNLFDVIIVFDVLEHLHRSEMIKTMLSIETALKPSGLLVLHVPNAWGRFGMAVRYGDLTHENCFTPESISQSLTMCGFDEIKCYEEKPTIHGFISSIRRILWEMISLFNRVISMIECGSSPTAVTRNILVTAKRRER
jgi:2-polyprenyl-3-methyl-5-hydroxy-6-metoxy-1,4-benzoquinol methylase